MPAGDGWRWRSPCSSAPWDGRRRRRPRTPRRRGRPCSTGSSPSSRKKSADLLLQPAPARRHRQRGPGRRRLARLPLGLAARHVRDRRDSIRVGAALRAGRSGRHAPAQTGAGGVLRPGGGLGCLAVQGLRSASSSTSGGYLWNIKPRNSDTFVSMASAAGVKKHHDGVGLAGVRLTPVEDLRIVDYLLSLSERWKLRVGAQITDQRAVGDALAARTIEKY